MGTNVQAEVLLLTGPTASGKSDLAHKLGLLSGAEIISCDSRQIYRELTIGSAKPSPAMLREVPYHFIDEKSLPETTSAGAFALEARERIESIHARGRRAIVVGGSTLYVQGLLEGFSDLPPADPTLRRRLQEELLRVGPETLYRRLVDLDPEQAATLDPTKTHRLIRSLEVIALTGTTLRERRAAEEKSGKAGGGLSFRALALDLPREELYGRIDERVGRMMEEGLREEARGLWERYRQEIEEGAIPALRTVGYQELFSHFSGEYPLERAVELIRQHTRNYAKRQLTFMRNRLTLEWIPPDTEPASLLRR